MSRSRDTPDARPPSNNSESVGRDSVRTIRGTGRSGWSARRTSSKPLPNCSRPEGNGVQGNGTHRCGRGVDVLYVSLACLAQRPRMEGLVNPVDMEPARDRFESGGSAITAPRPGASIRDQAGPHRVSDDVTRSAHEIGVTLNHQRTKPSFEDMSCLSMSAIRPLSKDSVDVLHRVGQVGLGRLENEVIVIPHQAESPEKQIVRRGCGTDDLEKLAPVLVVLKDSGFAVASGHHVVHRAGELQSGTSRHDAVMTKSWARRRDSETAEILGSIGNRTGTLL